VKTLIALIGLGAMATVPLRAQVGYPPTRSPYVDLEFTQELTAIGGWYHAHRDAANVGPQSGMITGLHYEWRAGGPAHLIAEVARISSERRQVNPFKTGTARELGTISRPLYSADFGLGLSLTGGKSWHRIVPEVTGGLGMISDFHAKPDTGGFRFGTRFALNWGGGIRIVPGGHWQIRGDIKNRLYTLGYPQTFYEVPSGGTSIVPSTQAKSFWLNNPAFTFGLSYLF
jgi:hypothetical protein